MLHYESGSFGIADPSSLSKKQTYRPFPRVPQNINDRFARKADKPVQTFSRRIK